MMIIPQFSIRNLLFSHLLLLTICCQSESNIKVVMETELGTINMDLYPEKAPVTVFNFLEYLDEHRYEDAHFYRVVHLKNQLGKTFSGLNQFYWEISKLAEKPTR